MKRIEEALRAYQKFNSVRNDFDAYLYALGEWALMGGPKPVYDDYGIPSPNKPLDSDRVYGAESLTKDE